jgi:hypothetical protein
LAQFCQEIGTNQKCGGAGLLQHATVVTRKLQEKPNGMVCGKGVAGANSSPV